MLLARVHPAGDAGTVHPEPEPGAFLPPEPPLEALVVVAGVSNSLPAR